ncbi:restriction endonuclease, SacI family [uncultured Psychrobacter sp.]|uniref:restriction endonuclease, SacI family n=1 Tax=uncultured Psychrobacter sp. TaxID=259303 RepID=UPI003458F85E
MSVTVDSARARKILKDSITEVIENDWKPKTKNLEKIKEVILGSHLTYRYILTTGIVAKAADTHCNPLALQSGSDLKGAYDARSICHSVVVPIEREMLGGRLGSSNEPFLNKPARYRELSLSNSVRKGRDTKLLKATIEVLSNLKTSKQAKEYLKDCIYFILQRDTKNLVEFLSSDSNLEYQPSLVRLATELTKQSFEGETCALLVGTTYSILGISQSKDFDVKVHKVNQAGTSSNEILDVDVYEENSLLYTIEVKDKVFTSEDVEHAVAKAVRAGSCSIIFAMGPRASLNSRISLIDLTEIWSEKGVNLYFVDIVAHFISILSLAENITFQKFVEVINNHVAQCKIKDTTFEYLKMCLKSCEKNE